ncbi:MAG: YegS/Rv2252/BmrU family lipid kinase, partial [Clostridia bacterium]|nr:YegS/Rv2252/BmrU family lipid kinase [Clostridia bacterium]
MKHVFIINPVAGFENSFLTLSERLKNFKDKYDITVYVTSSIKDATEYLKDFCNTHKDIEIRFYSCGGDGTLGEVVNGIAGTENASVTCFPCGSGNDFVKSVGGKEKFLDLENLFNAENSKIDLIKIENCAYSLNAINVGFEAKACKVANNLKGKSKNPYLRGVISALFNGMKNNVTVEVDGEVINPDGKLLLCTFANGGYVGGKYNCAPSFSLDDGLIEVCLIKPVSALTLIRLIKKYERGEHLDSPRFKKIITYRQAKRIKLYSNEEFDLCIDGEMYLSKEFNIELQPKFLNFAIPKTNK